MASSVPSEEADPHKMETTPIVPDVPLENDAVSQNLVRIAISFTAQSEGELTVTEGQLPSSYCSVCVSVMLTCKLVSRSDCVYRRLSSCD